MKYLEIKEVFTHNLKGFDLKIPLNSLTVITGPSGSGKSSLAIDTIAKEGIKRIYQILNYSQQSTLNDSTQAKFISPIPPVIALSQGIKDWDPYKTVGEFLSIYQTLYLLFQEYGEYKCLKCGEFNKVNEINQLIKWYQNLKEGQKFYFLLPLVESSPKALEFLVSQGYTKYLIDEKEIDLSEEKIPSQFNKIYLILDRMIKEKGVLERFVENLRMSLSLNQGKILLKLKEEGEYFFNLKPQCLNCGSQLQIKWIKCKSCRGLGYKEKKECSECKGLKLNPIILESKIFNKVLKEILKFTLEEFYKFLSELKTPTKLELWKEAILNKLEKALFLEIGKLKVSEPVFKLSVGERKLLELLFIFTTNLNKIIYVLDEPTLGLDIKRRQKLLFLLRDLIKKDNSIIVVEHDPFIISNADFIIELGPEGGESGGYLIKADFKEKFFKTQDSLTSKYLEGKLKIKTFSSLKKKDEFISIEVNGQKIDLLKGDANLIYGETSAGKTAFLKDLLEACKKRGEKVLLVETTSLDKKNELLISYTGIWDDLREILAKLPAARIKGLEKKHFSFYNKEGVCSGCKGKGEKILETENIKLISLCEECLGKRLNQEVLNLIYKGFKVSEIFDFTLDLAFPLFVNIYSIKEKILQLKELNLSYLKLAQNIRELSGGEKSRLFLAKKLSNNKDFNFLFLEFPLQGLHLKDIENFIKWLKHLKTKEKTIVILETNPLAIFLCNWIIEIEDGKPKFIGEQKKWIKEIKNRIIKKNLIFYQKFFN